MRLHWIFACCLAAGSPLSTLLASTAESWAEDQSQTVSVNATSDEDLGIELNAGGPADDSARYVVLGGPLHGRLTGTAPDFVYSPNPGFVGHDIFEVHVDSPANGGRQISAEITVRPSVASRQTTPQSTRKVHLPQTPLAAAVRKLKAGQFVLLETQNINPTLRSIGSSKSLFGYTDDIRWDPISEQLFYLGSDHGGPAQFATYSAASNTWQRQPRQPWFFSGAGGASHGYDHSAIDPKGRAFFHRPAGFTNAYRFDIDTRKWSETPSFKADLEYIACCSALEYFPELGGLVFVSVERNIRNAAVLILTDGAKRWRRLASDLPMGNYHTFGEYNPVHKVLIFGGGNGSNAVYKLDREEKVTRLGDAPVNLGIQQTVVTVDPAGGDYLIFTKDKEFYRYDVVSDEWTLQDLPVPIWYNASGNPIHGVVATPLTSYGVTLFVTCQYNSGCRVNLYRNVDDRIDEATFFPTVSLTATPAVVAKGATAVLSWTGSPATTCAADWTDNRSINGNETVAPTGTEIYSITCSAGRFSTSASVEIAVSSGSPDN